MRKQLLMLVLLAASVMLPAQVVDNITVEQTGDYIRIGYRILDSKPGETYRVRILCSINGGLNTEIKSVSGDTGDNVQGGKEEYFALWDVLKDVEELTSAEFIVRAELLGAPARTGNPGKDPVITAKWSKKWIHVAPVVEFPGPRPGFFAGFLGPAGVAISVNSGKHAKPKEIFESVGQEITLDEFLEGETSTPVMLLITARIVNYNSLQVHLMAGVNRRKLVFNDPQLSGTPYKIEKMFGPAAGVALAFNHVFVTFIFNHIDPGPIEKGTNWGAYAPLDYFTAGAGIRF